MRGGGASLYKLRIGVACVAEEELRLNDKYSASLTEVYSAMSVGLRVSMT